MTALTIRIKKKTDGSAALTCVRADGTTTWQRQEGALGRFFPLHDLTHYAVETELGYRKGFYGMVASGWDLTDFAAPWPKGPIPADMDPSEIVVGFLDTERASNERWTADDFNEKARIHCEQRGGTPPAGITDEALGRVRARRSELFARWRELKPGDTMELPWG